MNMQSALPRTDAERPQVVLTVNGPGEVSSWLLPFVTELRRRVPDVRICVALMPCVFSTGAEHDVVQAIESVDSVCTIGETLALAVRGKLPDGFRKGGTGFVLHLGGERWISWSIAKRLKLPVHAYVEEPFLDQPLFDRVFFSGFHAIPERQRGPRGMMIGEMMIDAARQRCPVRQSSPDGRKTVGLYPGSRSYIAMFTLPFMAVIAEKISRTRPDVQFVLAKADFLALDFLKAIPRTDDGRPLEGIDLTYVEEGGRGSLQTPSGFRIPVMSPMESAAMIDLAVTIPGTNTAEMAALGIPMVVVLPTWWAEVAPLPGLAGHVGRLPLVGKWLKRLAAHFYLRSLGHTAHPNRRAKRLVVPEVVGRITAKQVSDEILRMLDGNLVKIEADLHAIMGPPGATKRLVDILVPSLTSHSEAGHP